MLPRKMNIIILCRNQFQTKYYQKLLETTQAELQFYYDVDSLLTEIELWFSQFDLIIIDSYENKKELHNLIIHIDGNPDYLFKGFPFIFIENKGEDLEIAYFKQKGAHILSKPINSEILIKTIKDFLEPNIPRVNIHKFMDSQKKSPCIEIKRECPICENSLSLAVIDYKKTLSKKNIFSISETEALGGYRKVNLGDEAFICPHCLFCTDSKYDFISKTLNDSNRSILHGRDELKEKLKRMTQHRYEFFNKFYNSLNYNEKKDIGILGNSEIKFHKLHKPHVYFELLFLPPKQGLTRIFTFDLLIDTYLKILEEIHHDDIKKVIYIKIGNSFVKKALIKERMKMDSYLDDYKEAVKYYKLLLELGTSYFVLYRMAVIYDRLFDLRQNEDKKKETLRYLSYIFTAAHQSKHELFDQDKTKETKTNILPRGLFEQTENFYFELRERIKKQVD